MSPAQRPSSSERAGSSDAEAWARSGMRWLTGRADGDGSGPPQGFVERLDALTSRIESASRAAGRAVEINGLETLRARAAILGLDRAGTTSCGGASQLLRASDGWLALSLARPDDIDLLPAWLGTTEGFDPSAPWTWVAEHCRTAITNPLVEWGALLGIPLAVLSQPSTDHHRDVATVTSTGPELRPSGAPLRVADLSSLWAGPLCGSIFAKAGATVVKVESTSRPDGTRTGAPAFFDLVNGGKLSVALDLRSAAGIARLGDLLRSVDVVIEGSRPRALQQLGLDAHALLSAPDGPRVWISITGHGRGAGADRVAFGDDAAIAGGLAAWEDDLPSFCGDAIADPLAGLAAAALGLEACQSNRSAFVEVSMADVARAFSGATQAAGSTPASPPSRPVAGEAGPALGRDTRTVLHALKSAR